jgi:hypothetical protein
MRDFLTFLVMGMMVVIVGVRYAKTNPQFFERVIEQYIPRHFEPSSPEIASLAEQAGMSEKGKQIFYSTNPVIDTDRAVFEQHCKAPVAQNTVELGCYTSQNKIYILKIPDERLQAQMIVVAAHEMLHAAYFKLSANERLKIDTEVEVQLPLIQNKDLSRALRNYHETEPGQRDNELHSIIGTEYGNLNPELQAHYQEYFSNRQAVIAKAQEFNQVFASIETQLDTLKEEITAMRSTMQTYLRRGEIDQYNALVPEINAKVTEYNQRVEEYNELSRNLAGQEMNETTTAQ